MQWGVALGLQSWPLKSLRVFFFAHEKPCTTLTVRRLPCCEEAQVSRVERVPRKDTRVPDSEGKATWTDRLSPASGRQQPHGGAWPVTHGQKMYPAKRSPRPSTSLSLTLLHQGVPLGIGHEIAGKPAFTQLLTCRLRERRQSGPHPQGT